jgi:uncharacterized membrane protein
MLAETNNRNEKTALFIIAFLFAGIEKFIPVFPFLPWLKIGLFHVITLIWLARFGILDTLAFIFIRQWVIMVFFGFSFMPFILGTGGSVASVILGGVLIKSKRFGIIAVAVFSALINNITQLLMLFFMMNGNFAWQWQLSVMTIVSVFTGTVTGFLAFQINNISFSFPFSENKNSDFDFPINIFAIFLLISVIFTSCVFENYIFYIILFLFIILVSKILNCKIFNVSDFIKKYGIFILALYFSSLFSQKTEFSSINFWLSPILHLTKISLWFMLAPFFQKSGFFGFFYKILLKIFPQRCSQTLAIGTIMPQIFPNILEKIPQTVKTVFKNPRNIIEILTTHTREILSKWEKDGCSAQE